MMFYPFAVLLLFANDFNVALSWGVAVDQAPPRNGVDYVSRQNLDNDPVAAASLQQNHHVERGTIAEAERGPEAAVATNDDRNRRQQVNGRSNPQYQFSNVTVEYSKENNTWKVDKQENKPIESSKEVLETQHATCRVTTEELVATAQATVTRVLKGLCHSKEMENHFINLEILLARQLSNIKEMIVNIEKKLGDDGEAILKGQKHIAGVISQSCTADTGSRQIHDQEETSAEMTGSRDPEMVKYNSSIHMEAVLGGTPKKVFTYYWKIKDIHHKLTGWSPQRSLRSQSFYIFPSGYRMYLRIYPRQNEEYFYIHAGVTRGDYDDELKWPFPLKHTVKILDQTNGRMFEDIGSRIWDPNQLCSEFNWQKPTKGDNYECVGLGFPHDVLTQKEYIRNDAIIIKLTVYLES